MFDAKKIFAPHNRTLLLDCLIFIVNTLLMFALAKLLAALAVQVRSDDPYAKLAMGLYLASLVFLQPVAAILKRRRAHARNGERFADWGDNPMNRIWLLYFIAQLMFSIFGSVILVEAANQLSGKSYTVSLVAPLFFGIPALAFVNTFILYFYFLPIKHAPVFKFLETPQAEALGDLCLFINLLCYQMFWLYLMTENIKDHRSVLERLFFFGFCAVFIYFPPRLFYIVENYERPRTWLMMALANAPILIRLLIVWR